MNFYIDIENLLLNEIPVPPEYGLERDKNQNILFPRNLIEVESDNRNSIIPSIGFVFDFQNALWPVISLPRINR